MLAQLFVEDARSGWHFKNVLVKLVLLYVLKVIDVRRLVSTFLRDVILRALLELLQVRDPVDYDEAVLVLAHAGG